ncbi:MAG: phosphatase PAP2 family protein [Methylococcaceae bacterium]|jgi:membrane-associated PAP2 superfamily phosphatase
MFFSKWERRWQELFILLALAVLTTPVFWLTDLDRQAAALFHQAGTQGNPWPNQHWWLWRYLYEYAFTATIMVAVIALLLAVFSHKFAVLMPYKKPALYILLVIVLGPGLMINLIFKDHWGRPRPVHITDFGGQYQYIPPLQIGHTPEKSFPCGHCSVGYLLFTLYFLSSKRKALYFGIALGLAMVLAITRMSAGGHFVSDILWSGYLVFFVAWLVYYSWYVRGSS